MTCGLISIEYFFYVMRRIVKSKNTGRMEEFFLKTSRNSGTPFLFYLLFPRLDAIVPPIYKVIKTKQLLMSD